MNRPSKHSAELKDPELESIARKVESDEYMAAPNNKRTSAKAPARQPSETEISRLTLLSMFTPDDRKERISREPGNEGLFEEKTPEGIHFTGAVDLFRGDVSSALDVSTLNSDEEELEEIK